MQKHDSTDIAKYNLHYFQDIERVRKLRIRENIALAILAVVAVLISGLGGSF